MNWKVSSIALIGKNAIKKVLTMGMITELEFQAALYCTGENSPLKILEIGFGTGLNAFITLLESKKINAKVEYTGVEAYPVVFSEIEKMNYSKELKASKDEL